MIKLNNLGACKDGIEWAERQESYEKAWNDCKRGDWMLWIAKKRGFDLQKLTGAKAECAGLVRHLMRDERSKKALDVALRFASGNANLEDLRDAASDAYSAVSDAYAYDTDAFAYAAATAAAVADVNAGSAVADPYTGAAAADADDGYDDADADASNDILSKSADICRKWINYKDLNMGD